MKATFFCKRTEIGGQVRGSFALIQVAIGALGAAMMLGLRPAAAYCRTAACGPKGSVPCVTTVEGCEVGGPYLYWPSTCIGFAVHDGGAPLSGFTTAEIESAALRAFDTWFNQSDCGNESFPRFQVEYAGRISCAKHEYNPDGPNVNLIVAEDSWPYVESGSEAIGLTTVTYSRSSGRILDADVELNATEIALEREAFGSFDMAPLLLHEVGHLLGLAHSPRDESVMDPFYHEGRQNLTADDVAGVCDAMSPGRKTETSSCSPVNGFSAECSAASPTARGVPQSAGGCSLRPRRSTPGPSWLSLGLFVGLVRRLRRPR